MIDLESIESAIKTLMENDCPTDIVTVIIHPDEAREYGLTDDMIIGGTRVKISAKMPDWGQDD